MDEMKVKNTVRRMTEERALLIKNNPFFGHLSMGLQLACAPCKTACTDGSRLIFDPAFAEKLSDQEPVSYTHLDVYKRQEIALFCFVKRSTHSVRF